MKEVSDQTQLDDVGVVIIGRNEGERLVNCLRSIQTQVGRVVYVDSGSTDGSIAAAEAIGASIVRLSTKDPFTAGRARNTGFQRLMEDSPTISFVQFVDGDCQIDSKWMRTARGFLNDRPMVAVVCGRRHELFPSVSIFNQLCDLEWNTPIGEAENSGGDFLVRSAVFNEVGGFRPEIMAGEEPELCNRMRKVGHRVWRLDAPMTLHDANILSFRQWWKRTKRTGYGYAQVNHLSRREHAPVYSRELMRTVFWGGALPALILGAGVWYPPSLFAAAAYTIPLVRVAYKMGLFDRMSWIHSAFLVAGKFAEFHGVATYVIERAFSRSQAAIEYKAVR